MRVTRHVSPPEDPAPFQKILDHHAGLNLFGAPNVRIVWSESATVLEETPVQVFGVERMVPLRVPKYPLISERWVLECWYPAGHFGPVTDESGSHGSYEWTATLDMAGEFVRPTWEILVRACRLLLRARSRSLWDRVSEARRRKDREERAQRAQDFAIIDDGYPAFGPRPHVSMAGGR